MKRVASRLTQQETLLGPGTWSFTSCQSLTGCLEAAFAIEALSPLQYSPGAYHDGQGRRGDQQEGTGWNMEMMRPTWSTPLPMMPGQRVQNLKTKGGQSPLAMWVFCPGYHGNQDSRKGKQGSTINDRDKNQRFLMWRLQAHILLPRLEVPEGLEINSLKSCSLPIGKVLSQTINLIPPGNKTLNNLLDRKRIVSFCLFYLMLFTWP